MQSGRTLDEDLAKLVRQSGLCFVILFPNEFLTSCNPAVSPALPSEKYNGRLASQVSSLRFAEIKVRVGTLFGMVEDDAMSD